MKSLVFLFSFCLCIPAGSARAAEAANPEIARRVAAARPHPRLMVNAETFAKINEAAEKDSRMGKMRQSVFEYADKLIGKKPVARELEGRRLLSVSREALARISALAMAYRLKKDPRWLARAEKEMRAVCEFKDWNPNHFLDVAEMTLALAFGYDWLFEDLTPETRSTVRAAILEKGIKPSFAKKHGWIQGTNNWNQVCHGGITAGALAILEDEPELAARTVQRAVEGVPHAMEASYDPDGAYPEGPSYWAYGTTFNVVLLSCLNSALGTDFGLGKSSGFDVTGVYLNMCAAPSGQWFNYADCGSGDARYLAALSWLAGEFDRPGLARLNRGETLPSMRDAVVALIWELAGGFSAAEVAAADPLPPGRLFGGKKPIWIYCSSWADPNAAYLAVCGGTPRSNHGHMDSGAFLYESGGIRWGIDLGSQGYHSLESKGVDLWNSRQDGQRWEVFRLNNHSHNTLVFDGALQQVAGFAELKELPAQKPGVEADLTSLYQISASKITRRFEVKDDRAVTIRDEIAGLEKATSLRWGMATRADIELKGPEAILRQGGRQLNVRFEEPGDGKFQVIDMEKPPHPYDARNPGVRMLTLEVSLSPRKGPQSVTVTLAPGKAD